MDLERKEQQFSGNPTILTESFSILKRAPKIFFLITLSLITRFSLAIIVYLNIVFPIILHMILSDSPYLASFNWYSLLSSAAVVFTVSSVYTNSPVSLYSTIAKVPSVLKRLLITYFWVSLYWFVYYFFPLGFLLLGCIALDKENVVLVILAVLIMVLLSMVVLVSGGGLWHLTGVVSVLEPVYGIGAMKKSYELLGGTSSDMFTLAFFYLQISVMINMSFAPIIYVPDIEVLTKIMLGVFLVCLQVIINLMMLLMQTVYYYSRKSYLRHQMIGNSALCTNIETRDLDE